MSSRKSKRTTTTKSPSLVLPPTPDSNPVPSLPNDLILSCLARVPISYYQYLSLVSKSFRSLLASPELYTTRSLLDRTESCLYVCLKFPSDPNPRLFTLCRKPKEKKKKKSSGNILVPIPSPCSRAIPSWSCLVAASSDICKIEGSVEDGRLLRPSSFTILDCRSHTWCDAPIFLGRRVSAGLFASTEIYVEGDATNSHDSIKVFDRKTQTWDFAPMFNYEEVLKVLGLKPWSYCWIENVMYRYFHHVRELQWYDTKTTMWKTLKGLGELPKFARSSQVSLANYGGKMAVLWDKSSRSTGYKKMIWCGEIALERRCQDDEIWGKVELLDGVLPVPDSYKLLNVLAIHFDE